MRGAGLVAPQVTRLSASLAPPASGPWPALSVAELAAALRGGPSQASEA